ncbi:DNA replication and repair protein RecN [Clostridium cavendishii DSM 21758]|uniref:DNA repair protein RecN n=1 Tax=Clostridium cavendishii DSM 21758 TaxID=1121302 RepID=A0A1M6KIV2_9CLOT|nr:DNA repair protein RecN [Clostridium cavendishii]SHJ58918.1 DNA replication and repair protein RecN [Clostridium cavendishii DSM 21758]
MLLQLSIKNFALIEKLSLDFSEGFSILSGETGAGKSILIDAINYVLGSKFNKELIRTGETKTVVEAIFTIENEKIKNVLEENNIEYDDSVIISRETFQNGKSIIKVNDKAVILSTLKKISEKLIDIHGQHNNQNLLDKENHIHYLDSFAENEIDKYLLEYKENYVKLKEIESKIDEISNQGENDKLLDYIKFQLDEINNAKVILGEDEELNERFNILSNAEKISNSLQLSYNSLNGEDDKTVIQMLSVITKELSHVEKHSEKIKVLNNNIFNIYYSLEDISRELRAISEETVYDEIELEKINSRLYKLASLKKKYGGSIESILETRNKLQAQYDSIVNGEEIIKKLNEEKALIVKKLKEIGKAISEIRKKFSQKLEEKVQYELKYIGLEKCTFKVCVEQTEKLNSKGIDEVQFMISTNPGEPIRPMEKIVSGGELSRIMLALKCVFIDKDEIPTVIFDEIDTGISGRVAQSVAEKMYEISTKHQIFCISHLPQIGSMSDTHYLVKKHIEGDKTFTKVTLINVEEKAKELAFMLGGVELTEITLQSAKEMIRLADEKKKKIRALNT